MIDISVFLEEPQRDAQRIGEAIKFATEAHMGDNRKGTPIPYIFHPLEVGKILAEWGCTDDLVIAGMLHDVLEDTRIPIETIRRAFGEKVAELVEGVTEPDDGPRDETTWQARKQNSIDYLAIAPIDILVLVLADKLSNIRSIAQDFVTFGDELWTRFNAAFPEQRWYYHNLALQLRRLDDILHAPYSEFCCLVEQVFDPIPHIASQ